RDRRGSLAGRRREARGHPARPARRGIEAARGAAARGHPRPGPLVLARAVRDRESRPVPRRADLIVEEGPVAGVPESLTVTGLGAPGRSPEIPEPADAYSWLVGSWELDV